MAVRCTSAAGDAHCRRNEYSFTHDNDVWCSFSQTNEGVRLGGESLLDDDRLDALVTPAVTFQALPARLPDILNAESNILCQLIRYP